MTGHLRGCQALAPLLLKPAKPSAHSCSLASRSAHSSLLKVSHLSLSSTGQRLSILPASFPLGAQGDLPSPSPQRVHLNAVWVPTRGLNSTSSVRDTRRVSVASSLGRSCFPFPCLLTPPLTCVSSLGSLYVSAFLLAGDCCGSVPTQ